MKFETEISFENYEVPVIAEIEDDRDASAVQFVKVAEDFIDNGVLVYRKGDCLNGVAGVSDKVLEKWFEEKQADRESMLADRYDIDGER